MAVSIEIKKFIHSAPQENTQPSLLKYKINWSTPTTSRISLSLLPRTPREVLEIVWCPIYVGYKLVRDVFAFKNSSLEERFNYHFRDRLPEVPVVFSREDYNNGRNSGLVLED